MKRTPLILLCLWWTGSPGGLPAQSPEPCQQQLAAYLKTMSRHAFPHQREWYHLRLKVSTFPRPGSRYAKAGRSGENLDVDILMGKEALFYESNHLAMYQDLQTVLTVIHPTKTIIRTKADPGELPGKSALAQQLSDGQRQWLEGASLKGCRDTLYQGKPTKIIALQPATRPGTVQSIQLITYYYTPSEQKLQRQVIDYRKDHPIARQVITFVEMDFDYGGKHPRTAYEQVFAGGRADARHPPAKSQLRPKYRSYQVKVQ